MTNSRIMKENPVVSRRREKRRRFKEFQGGVGTLFKLNLKTVAL
jgi:hypothetical protein